MATIDHMLDLGRDYTTRLSLVAAVVPIRWVTMTPPFPIEPVAYAHLKHGLGVLPVYTPLDEVADFMDTEVPLQMVALASNAWVARDEMVAVMPVEIYEEDTLAQAESDAGFLPACFVRIVTNAMVLPCFYSAGTMAGEMKRGIAGYFGE